MAWSQVAARQLGLITSEQLLAAGLSPAQRRTLYRRGELIAVHRHVFRVSGAPRTREQTWLAAVLALPRAALSHRAAAGAWGIRRMADSPAELVVGRSRAGRLQGVTVHRAAHLTHGDVMGHGPFPRITRPGLTLIHLAELDGIDDDALEEAGADLLLGFPREQARLRRQLSLFRGHGPSRVEALFGEYLEDGRRPPHPGLEKSLLAAVEHLGPVVHYRVPTPVGPLEVDLAWPDCKLAVEADSARWHSSPAHLRTDRQRDQALAMVGWTVLRFTWTQVRDQVGYVVDCITRVRAQRASG